MFLGGRERVHWERMGLIDVHQVYAIVRDSHSPCYLALH